MRYNMGNAESVGFDNDYNHLYARLPVKATITPPCLAGIEFRHGNVGLAARGEGGAAHLTASADAAPFPYQGELTE